MSRILVPMLLLPLVSSSSTYIQTDWSGGPGAPGPVEDWGSAFQQETHICWSTPGRVSLDTNYVEQNYMLATPIMSGQGSPTAICSSDFNGDGLEDIAGGFWSTGRIYVVLNPGAGPWLPILVDAAAPEPVMLSAADFDGDGDADLAVSESGSDRISWFQNSGTGSSWTKRTVGASWAPKPVLPFGTNVAKSAIACIAALAVPVGLGIGGGQPEPVTVGVSPSPAGSVVFVRASGIGPAQATVMLFDLSGRLVESVPLGADGTAGLDASALQPGVYLVRVSGGDGLTGTARLVVCR